MKPARVAQRTTRHGVRGLSLIELMVGMALALLAIVAIYQVLSVWDARKRTITSGSSAQISGGIGIFELERDLQLSGGGFGNVSAATIGCTVNAYNSTFDTPAFSFTLVPVEIVQGASGAPDTVRVLYGNSAFISSIQKLQSSSQVNNTKTLQYRAGFNAGDLMVVAGNSPRNCELFEVTGNSVADTVTVTHGTASYTNFYTAASKTPTMNPAVGGTAFTDGEVYNLGPNPQRTVWSISGTNGLTRTNSIAVDSTEPATEVTEGVVNLQAEYGVDGSDGSALNGRIEAAERITTTPTDWTKVLAVRVAVLARSSQLELQDVTTTAPVWQGGTFIMFNLDGSVGSATPTSTLASDSWKRYRYRVYETVVPMRNMIWGATS